MNKGYKSDKMGKISGVFIIVFLLLVSFVSAQTDQDPKVLPDSLLWNLKTFGQDMRLLVTFNQMDKMRLRLDYMDERLKEISNSKSLQGIEKARLNYEKHLKKVGEISTMAERGLKANMNIIVKNSISRNLIALNQVKAKLEAKNISTQGIDNAILKSTKSLSQVQARNGGSVLIEQGEL